ncbi:hypothetical protein HY994_05315 [Candidatus Micrarchaeota archaeon]|nr:hypothetical protein [Candidatus Micrarchaeota archaeon]
MVGPKVDVTDETACSDCHEEHELCTCALRTDAGVMSEVTVNGKAYLMARMRFSQPSGFRHLLNPFAKVMDKNGRVYSIRSLSDKARVISAVKKGEPLDVLYRPTEHGFDLVRLGLDWLE